MRWWLVRSLDQGYLKAYAITQDTPYFGVILLLWVGGGIFTFLGALAYAEVVTLFPRAGGNYTFLKEAYGPMWGFLWGGLILS